MKTMFHNLQNFYEYLEKLGPGKSFKLMQGLGYKRVTSLSVKIHKDRIIYLAKGISGITFLDLLNNIP